MARANSGALYYAKKKYTESAGEEEHSSRCISHRHRSVNSTSVIVRASELLPAVLQSGKHRIELPIPILACIVYIHDNDLFFYIALICK